MSARDAARRAVLGAVAGMVANVLLVGFFALARPWRSTASNWSWLGPANDAFIVVQHGALLPVALGLRDRLRGGPVIRTAGAIGVAAMAAVVVLQLGLLTGAVDLGVQGPAVTACIALVFIWMLVVGCSGGLPRAAARFAVVVGAAFLLGAVIAGIALLLPAGSVGQDVGFGLAAAVGWPGWLAFPVWPLLLARQVFAPRPHAGVGPPTGGRS